MSTDLEKRVSDLEIVIDDLPRILNVRFDNARDERRAIEARLDRIDGRLGKIDGRLDKIDGRLDILEGKVDALPHVLARMLKERDRG